MAAMRGFNLLEPAGDQGQCFVPSGWAKCAIHLIWIQQIDRVFGNSFAANERLGEPLFMMNIVKAIASLDAQAAFIGGPLATFDTQNGIALHVVSKLTAHTAIRAYGIHCFICGLVCRSFGWAQRTRGAGLYAFAAGHAGGLGQRITLIKHNCGMFTAKSQANDIVHLHVPAGAHAAGALNAIVHVYRDGWVGQVGRHGCSRVKPAAFNLHLLAPVGQFIVGFQRFWVCMVGHVGQQQFQHHFLRGDGFV